MAELGNDLPITVYSLTGFPWEWIALDAQSHDVGEISPNGNRKAQLLSLDQFAVGNALASARYHAVPYGQILLSLGIPSFFEARSSSAWYV